MHEWDNDKDGSISRDEFLSSVQKLGLKEQDDAAYALFDSVKGSGSGVVQLSEMKSLFVKIQDSHQLLVQRKAALAESATASRKKADLAQAPPTRVTPASYDRSVIVVSQPCGRPGAGAPDPRHVPPHVV